MRAVNKTFKNSEHSYMMDLQKHPSFTEKEQAEKSQAIFDLSEQILAVAINCRQSHDYIISRIKACNYIKPIHDTVIKQRRGADIKDTVGMDELSLLVKDIQIKRAENKDCEYISAMLLKYYIVAHTKNHLTGMFKKFANQLLKVDEIVIKLLDKAPLSERNKIEHQWNKNRCSKSWVKNLSKLSGFNISSIHDKYKQMQEQCSISLETVLSGYKKILTMESRLNSMINEFATANLRLVLKEIHGLDITSDQKMDVVQEGNIALIEATRSFNPEFGLVFSTYAVRKINRAIQLYFCNNQSIISVPHSLQFKLKKIEKIKSKQPLGNQLSFEEISDKTGISKEKIASLMMTKSSFIPVAGCGVADLVYDHPELKSTQSYQPESDQLACEPAVLKAGVDESEHSQEEMHEILRKSCHVLTPKQRKIIEMRLGIGMRVTPGFNEFSKFSDINYVGERIRQIQTEAVKLLKKEVGKHV